MSSSESSEVVASSAAFVVVNTALGCLFSIVCVVLVFLYAKKNQSKGLSKDTHDPLSGRMMTRDFLSLSLSLLRVSTKKQRRERERARKKAAFRDAAQRCFKEQRFSLSLFRVTCI